MSKPSESELLQATRRLLEKSEREVDELTVARLRAVRLRALDAIAHSRLASWWSLGGIASAGIAAALAGLLWFNTPSELSAPSQHETASVDMELLATKENPEFYTELDFYDWLAGDADAS
jgi:hypothetical protein